MIIQNRFKILSISVTMSLVLLEKRYHRTIKMFHFHVRIIFYCRMLEISAGKN